ncbi:Protein CHROMATIN REMODELING 5, variant 4 [Lathyrus oleraceus]|uniref:Protein CHROMATIN REMODELING 5, variant 4 n=1 Tax=Pisum sativum TaxID=3888 RepID=A0A9D4XC85_PEA|nr:Protein CHROMATIN REMODELING 5, variant 4 [Pisum sativum]
MNMEAQYESDAKPDEAGRKQKEATADNRVGTRESNVETKSRNPSTIGRWGSSFWKDCQPMCPQNGSESGPESKGGSDYRNADETEDHSLEGRGERLVSAEEDGQEDSGKGQRGHSDVPAEEMLSDEYYEQDGEEQSDSMHGRL